MRGKVSVLVMAVFVITACGGSSGDDGPTPTDPNRVFSLDVFQDTAPGPIYSYGLVASDSLGNSFSGSVSVINQQQSMYQGVLATPQEVTLHLSGPGGTATVSGIRYLDQDANLLASEIPQSGEVCTTVSPDAYPVSVSIGDAGSLSVLVCNDGTTDEREWRVEDAGNGRIDFVVSSTTRDSLQQVVLVATDIYTFDGDGNIVAYRAELIDGSYSMTVEST